MEQTATSIEKSLTPQQLAKRLGLSPKATRQLLRTEYPRDTKKKKWEISETLAKKVQRDYRARLKEKEAKKKVENDKELAGKI
ncbi:unnamed protein product [marine sediment metagenome]|uniref:Uncharacterized protein n=1 Tax=marine sediment metagenome TaxID=412755 RepID=X0T7T5_9ZZZZ